MARRRSLAPDRWRALLLMAPAAGFCLGVMAYPLVVELWLSFTSAQAGDSGEFIGLANFRFLAASPTFHQVLLNTLIYLGSSTVAKAVLGLGMALALARPFPGRRLVYAALLLPFLFPIMLSTSAWYFLLGNVHGGVDQLLLGAGLYSRPLDLKGAGNLPMLSVVLVNVWHGTAVFGILLLTGLRAVRPELRDAAMIDGARRLAAFRHIVAPHLVPGLVLAVLLSVLGTFGDFAIVFLLTGGGPLEKTEIVPTFAFVNALRAGDLGLGAAIAVSLLPVYCLGVVAVLRLQRR